MNISSDIVPGMQRLNRRLWQWVSLTPHLVDQTATEFITDVKADIQAGWPVASGASRGAWDGPKRVAPRTYILVNPVVYAWVIEYGRYPGVGPKTEKISGMDLGEGFRVNAGIYPRQKPAAPVRRALAAHSVDLRRRLLAAQRQAWRG